MTRRLALALLAGTALIPAAMIPAAAFASDLPTGGTVVAGQASIATPNANAMQITQTTDRAVIDWTNFSIGANARVDIAQPSATAALLNRVTSGATSTIAGQLNANGRVFLVNPNGILITSTGSVTAAGFVASTLDTSNAAFMGGSDDLTVVAPWRAGDVGVVKGGYAGLMQGRDRSRLLYAKLATVESDGTTRSAIDLEGNGFLQVALPKGGITVAGRITANEVVLTAGTAQDAARGVVNLTGTIAANSVTGTGGTVTLTGAAVNLTGATIDVSGATGGGSVRIGGDRQGTGTLAHATDVNVDAASLIKADATGSGNGGNVTLWSDGATSFAGSISAKGAGGGNGGEAEVSGHQLGYTGTTDLTGATFGTLLLDPYNVTISTAADDNQSSFTATGNDSVVNNVTLQNALATANVTVSTGAGGAQNGDITVAAPVTWSSNSLLTLSAAGSIAVNAPITVTGGGQVALNFSTANPLTGGLSFAPGSAITYADGQTGQALTVNGNAYTLLYAMSDVEGINNGLSGNYALAHDLDAGASGTYTDAVVSANGGNNFFAGTLEGLGHGISNLTIAATNDNAGLIGHLTGTIRDIGVVGGVVGGGTNIGGLVGYNGGTVINAYATDMVNGTSYVGGLVGYNNGTMTNAYATGAVSGSSDVGGLAGFNGGTVNNAYATGTVNGVGYSGGLVGENVGAISNAYATGAVTTVSGNFIAATGGLVGISSGTVTNAHATGAVSGSGFDIGGLVGLSTAPIDTVYATGAVTGSGSGNGNGSEVGGLVGFNSSTVNNAYATGAVTGSGGYVGGLVGYSAGTPGGATAAVGNAYATGAVSGAGNNVGGLIGGNSYGTATNAYATGAVTSNGKNIGGLIGSSDSGAAVSDVYATGAVSGSNYIGGLIGNNGGTLSNAYSTGTTSASLAFYPNVGGLTGYNQGTVTASYWNTQTNAASGNIINGNPSTGATGLTTAQFQSSGASALGGAFAGGANGLYPYLASFFPNGVQAVSGFAYTDTGKTPLASGSSPVYVYATVNGVNAAPTTTGANGYYYLVFANGTLNVAGTNVVTYTTAGNAAAATVTGAALASATGTATGLDIHQGYLDYLTAAATYSTAATAEAGLLATLAAGQQSALAALSPFYTATNAGGFTLDGAVSLGTSNLAVVATGALTLANTVAANTITLVSGGSVVNTVGASALTAGNRWLIYSTGPAGNTLGGLTPGFVQYNATFGTTNPAQASGNGLLYTLAPVLTLSLTGSITKTYTATTAATLTAANFTVTGAIGGDSVTLTTPASGTYANANVGTAKTVNANGVGIASATNGAASVYGYQLASTTVSGAIGAITPATLTYAATRTTRNYGNANPTLNGTVTGFVGGQSRSSATTGTLAFTSAATATSNVGSYAITGAGLTANNGNYVFVQAAANATALSVTARPITVTADALSRLYGDANPTLTYTVGGSGLVNGDALAGALATGATVTSNIGTYTIAQGSLAASSNYALTYTGANLSVTARPITVTADALSRLYGDANPTLTYTVGGSGLVNGDALAGALATGATVTSNIGTYTIAQGSLAASSNYALTYTGANLSVTARPITVTADALSRLYGDANPTLTYTVGGSGLVNGDALAGALATGATVTSNIGTYTIAQGSLAASSNYALTYTGANLSVTARPITVTADALSRLYGDANPTLTYTVGGSGLVNGDALAGALATGATVTSNIGTYTIAQGSLAASSNYALTYTGANLSVTARPITVTADALSRLYGDANPTLTYTVGGSGLVNGDALAGALATGATVTSNIGTYTIAQGSLAASSNYALTYTGANLSVTARPITVTADALSRLYGDANPTLTYTVGGSGLVNGDALAGALATGATVTSNIGTYTIAQGSLAASSNYALTYTGANLSVTARPITVTADALSRLYGDANPTLTYTVGGSGLVNGDALAGALATGATVTSNIGTYTIAQGSLAASSNYALTYTGANLTVGGAPVTPTLPLILAAGLRAGTVIRDGYADATPGRRFDAPTDSVSIEDGGVLSESLDPLAICVKYQGCGSNRVLPQSQ